MRKKLCPPFICILVVVGMFLSASIFGQSDSYLHRQVLGSIRANNLYQAASVLALNENLLIGFDAAAGFDIKEKRTEQIVIQPGSLREVLDSLVRQDPRYAWRVTDGVVNFFPLKSRDEEIRLLLEKPIGGFRYDLTNSRAILRDRILSSQEVQDFLNSRDIRLEIFVSTGSVHGSGGPDLPSAPLRQVPLPLCYNLRTP